jgi:hypothetical protein
MHMHMCRRQIALVVVVDDDAADDHDEKKDDCVFLSLDTREYMYRLLLTYKPSQSTCGSWYLPS